MTISGLKLTSQRPWGTIVQVEMFSNCTYESQMSIFSIEKKAYVGLYGPESDPKAVWIMKVDQHFEENCLMNSVNHLIQNKSECDVFSPANMLEIARNL